MRTIVEKTKLQHQLFSIEADSFVRTRIVVMPANRILVRPRKYELQIMKFLAEARLKQGEKFNLRAFHDFVWKNGNVPIALQRLEYLGPDGR